MKKAKRQKRSKRDGRAQKCNGDRLAIQSVADSRLAAMGPLHRTLAPRELANSVGPAHWRAAVERRFGVTPAQDLELTLRSRGAAVVCIPGAAGESDDTLLLRRWIRRRSGRHWIMDVVQAGIFRREPIVFLRLVDWTNHEVLDVKACYGLDADDVLTGLTVLAQKYGKPDALSLDHDRDYGELAKLILGWAVECGICIAVALPHVTSLPAERQTFARS